MTPIDRLAPEPTAGRTAARSTDGTKLMSRRSRTGPTKAPLTQAEMDRFRRNAPAALRRRGREFFLEHAFAVVEWVLIGGVPIVGLVAWGWSALEMLAFLLIGAWTSFVCDLLRCVALYPHVVRRLQIENDDTHVWAVVSALRRNSKVLPTQAPIVPGGVPLAFAADVVLGGLGTAGAVALMVKAQPDLAERLWMHRPFVYGVFGLAGSQLARLAWEIAMHGVGRARDQEPRLAVGARGLLLFLLIFALLSGREFAESDVSGIRVAMVAVNASIVALAILAGVGLVLMRRDAKWLERRLRDDRAGFGERASDG